MPLLKGKSKKVVSSFFVTMSNMSPMFKRVAIWAENLKVRQVVISPVSIFVMDAQYFGGCAIPASFACLNHASHLHIFSNSPERRTPHFFFRFINAFYTAINSRFGGVCVKFFCTMFAIAKHGPLEALRFIITLFATIFCSVRTRRNVGKLVPTNFTVCCNLHPCSKTLATSGTILKTVKSVFGNIDKSFAMPATQFFTCKGF